MLSTATKIRIARGLASGLLSFGVEPQRLITRNNIVYEVDIREGIDLSLFLFGSFQRHILRLIGQCVATNGIVIDVGANVGAMTLPIAAQLADGHVYAFEPTEFAFGKLQRNVQLNPLLSTRITLLKSFVADKTSDKTGLVAYSSWPVTGQSNREVHPIHHGVTKPTTCGQTTLDDFVNELSLTRLSLIKIDTDGHEYSVLSGATGCLRRFKPVVLFEACEYLMRSPRPTYADFEAFFKQQGYTIRLGINGRSLTAGEFHDKCPSGGGLDLVAVSASAA